MGNSSALPLRYSPAQRSGPTPVARSAAVTEATRACRGWPETTSCPVLIQSGIWCQGCLLQRQRAYAEGIPSDVVPVGIVLEDFDAPKLQCRCGGDPEAPRHAESLLHLKWSWIQTEAAKIVDPGT